MVLAKKRLFRTKNFFPGSPNTLVTLTHPYPLVTFRLKPFFSGI